MKKRSFSYAEAMVTMLIVAIIMVATTPILSQRKNVNTQKIWEFATNQSGNALPSAFFGTGTEQKVLIGTNSQKDNEDARLVLLEGAGVPGVNATKPIMKVYDANNNTEFGRLITNATSVGLGANVLSAATVTNSVAIGAGALSQANGDDNTAIGSGACANVTSGTNNICIGKDAGPSNGEASNGIYIGKLSGGGNNHLIEGNIQDATVSIRGTLKLWDGSSFQKIEDYVYKIFNDQGYFSDARLKNIGKESKAGLAEINKIVVKKFTYKNDKNKNPHVGVIAQELQKVFPNSVKKGEDGFLRIKTEEMFYAMLNAIKELDAKFNKNDAKIQKMYQEIESLRQENIALKQKITEIEQTLQKK